MSELEVHAAVNKALANQRPPHAVVRASDGRRYTVFLAPGLRQRLLATKHLLQIIWLGGLPQRPSSLEERKHIHE